MSISPHHYRGVIREAKELIQEVQAYLNWKTPDGLTRALQLISEIDELIGKCDNTIGELSVYEDGLLAQSPKRDRYSESIENLMRCKEELTALKSKIMAKSNKSSQ